MTVSSCVKHCTVLWISYESTDSCRNHSLSTHLGARTSTMSCYNLKYTTTHTSLNSADNNSMADLFSKLPVNVYYASPCQKLHLSYLSIEAMLSQWWEKPKGAKSRLSNIRLSLDPSAPPHPHPHPYPRGSDRKIGTKGEVTPQDNQDSSGMKTATNRHDLYGYQKVVRSLSLTEHSDPYVVSNIVSVDTGGFPGKE